MYTKTTTDDQQSVTMISEETDLKNDTETDQTYDHSTDQEANMDFCLQTLVLSQTQMRNIAKYHKFIKEELTNLLEAGLTERSLSPYAAPIIVEPHKALPGSGY